MMDPVSKNLDPEAKANNKPISFPNGTIIKHHHPRSPPPPAAADSLYRECLKNHAASLGGHAFDGCGEFISSPSSNPSDPTSLKCAACGCHRNFHRRLPDPRHHHVTHSTDEIDDDRGHDRDDEDDVEEDGEEVEKDDLRGTNSAPRMLLSLSTGYLSGGPTPITPTRKRRCRTKFSREQKEGMLELAERVGWKLQRRDEGVVEEGCRRLGVERGVFKVWMHNNKQAMLGARIREMGSNSGGGYGDQGGDEGNGSGDGNGTNNKNNNDDKNHVAVNCSSPST